MIINLLYASGRLHPDTEEKVAGLASGANAGNRSVAFNFPALDLIYCFNCLFFNVG